MKQRCAGFSLVELVITIVITGIIFSIVGLFLNRPIQAYTQLYSISDITNMADLAVTRIEKDVRNAVPNSVRVKTSGNLRGVEMVNAIEGVRYRAKNPGGANATLNIGSNDTDFDIEGKFRYAAYGANGYRLVIYNTGAFTGTADSPNAGVNVYSTVTASGPIPPAGSSVITPSATVVTLTSATNDHVNMNPAMNFGMASPRQRLYVVDTPIGYVCNLTAGTLTRYWGYTIASTQPIDATIAPLNGASSALLAKNVSNCVFTYNPGTSARNGVLGVNITITRNSESAQLYYQINSNNAS
jgi:MSHA biogenesis protein MshO